MEDAVYVFLSLPLYPGVCVGRGSPSGKGAVYRRTPRVDPGFAGRRQVSYTSAGALMATTTAVMVPKIESKEERRG